MNPLVRPPIRAAIEVAAANGIEADRCEILQDGSTLVVRLTESLVARVVPLHPEIPPVPHEHLGYPMNFWRYVTAIADAPQPNDTGRTLWQCHDILRSFPGSLPKLAILSESLAILDERELFPAPVRELLRNHLQRSLQVLASFPHQPLHGDAHLGNLMNTTLGLLWTDWEDAFLGPVEWDIASAIWNAQILDEDHALVDQILEGYQVNGGRIDGEALRQSLIARAAVMTVWYPILYPNPDTGRRAKLERRIAWLTGMQE